MLTQYIAAAMHKAKYEILADDDTYYGELPGCHSQGDTLDEAAANIKEAIELYLETLTADPPAGGRIANC